MDVNKKIDLYLKESKLLDDNKIDEDFDITNDPTISSLDSTSLTTGLRRIQIHFAKANTPRKYAIAFEIANEMVQRFPLKAKVILQTVVDAYKARFGG